MLAPIHDEKRAVQVFFEMKITYTDPLRTVLAGCQEAMPHLRRGLMC